MENFSWFFLLILVLPVVWAIGSALQVDGAKVKFANLGVIAGRSKDEIIAAVGAPNSVSSIGDAKELLQWQLPGYHIALIFTNGICDGVSHEYSA